MLWKLAFNENLTNCLTIRFRECLATFDWVLDEATTSDDRDCASNFLVDPSAKFVILVCGAIPDEPVPWVLARPALLRRPKPTRIDCFYTRTLCKPDLPDRILLQDL